MEENEELEEPELEEGEITDDIPKSKDGESNKKRLVDLDLSISESKCDTNNKSIGTVNNINTTTSTNSNTTVNVTSPEMPDGEPKTKPNPRAKLVAPSIKPNASTNSCIACLDSTSTISSTTSPMVILENHFKLFGKKDTDLRKAVKLKSENGKMCIKSVGSFISITEDENAKNLSGKTYRYNEHNAHFSRKDGKPNIQHRSYTNSMTHTLNNVKSSTKSRWLQEKKHSGGKRCKDKNKIGSGNVHNLGERRNYTTFSSRRRCTHQLRKDDRTSEFFYSFKDKRMDHEEERKPYDLISSRISKRESSHLTKRFPVYGKNLQNDRSAKFDTSNKKQPLDDFGVSLKISLPCFPHHEYANKCSSKETSYEDLLEQYKKIQNQLEDLRRQEEKSFLENTSNKEACSKKNEQNFSRNLSQNRQSSPQVRKGRRRSYSVLKLGKRSENKSKSYKSKDLVERKSPVLQEDEEHKTDVVGKAPASTAPIKGDDDDEEDLENLRQIALQSYSRQVTKKHFVLEDKNENHEKMEKLEDHKNENSDKHFANISQTAELSCPPLPSSPPPEPPPPPTHPPPEQVEVLSSDNYEMVEMDIDSLSDDEHRACGKPSEIGTGVYFSGGSQECSTVDTDEDNIDEVALRRQLLSTLATRKLLKETNPVRPLGDAVEVFSSTENINYVEKPKEKQHDALELKATVDDIDENEDDSYGLATTVKKKYLPELHYPVHKPLVINLADDSESDNSDVESSCKMYKEPTTKSEIPAGLDEFLKMARMKSSLVLLNRKQDVERHLHNFTPSLLNPGHPERVSTSDQDNNSVTVSKLSEAQQQEYRKLKAEIAKRVLTSKQDENVTTSTSNSLSEYQGQQQKQLIGKAHKRHELNLKFHKSVLQAEQSKLISLKKRAQDKKASLLSAEIQVQKLQERVIAAQRVVAANKRLVDRLTFQISMVERKIESEATKVEELERFCSSSSYKDLPVTVHVSAVPVMKRRVVLMNNISNTGIKKPRLSTLSNHTEKKINSQSAKQIYSAEELAEKKRQLQQKERELASQLMQMKLNIQNNSSSTPSSPARLGSKQQIVEEKKNLCKRKVISNVLSQHVTSKTNSNSASHSKVKIDEDENITPVQNIMDQDKSLVSCDYVNTSPLFTEHSEAQAVSKQELEKLMQSLSAKNVSVQSGFICPTFIHSYQLCQFFYPRIHQNDEVRVPSQDESTGNSERLKLGSNGVHYSSPLVHMKSYRLNPHFSTHMFQECSSSTYSNQINPLTHLCRFDLLGTCNDDQCTRQHEANYKTLPQDVLLDLLCYCPSLCGVSENDSTQDSLDKLKKYVEVFCESCSDLSLEEKCEKLVKRINVELQNGPTSYVILQKRKFLPRYLNKNYSELDGTMKLNIKQTEERLQLTRTDYDPDAVILESDSRYFKSDCRGLAGLEAAVHESPHNIQLWLKLAYHHLHNHIRKDISSLDQALNILSRGLESNPADPELWRHYLTLYAERDQSKDILQLCQQALNFCPHYEVWWKYLQLAEGYHEKQAICNQILQFLLSEQQQMTDTDKSTLSHRILEVLLFQSQLNVQSGHYRNAVDFLEKTLRLDKQDQKSNFEGDLEEQVPSLRINDKKSENESYFSNSCGEQFNNNSSIFIEEEPVTENNCGYKENMMSEHDIGQYSRMPVTNVYNPLRKLMVPEDLCLAWMCYIHLIEFHSLPSFLFPIDQDAPGRLGCKDPFLIPWHHHSPLQTSYNSLLKLFKDALHSCSSWSSRKRNIEICLPLYQNLIFLEINCNRFSSAVCICQRLLQEFPTIVDLWLILAGLYAQKSMDAETQQVFQEAISSLSYHPRLCHAAALYEISKNNKKNVKEYLYNCVKEYFIIPHEDGSSSSFCLQAEALYSKLLGQPGSESQLLPQRKTDKELLEEEVDSLWLNYICLLQCQDVSSDKISEVFETAISCVNSTYSSREIWWEYLFLQIALIGKTSNKQTAMRTLTKLVHRCLMSITTKFTFPHLHSKQWNNYIFHNAVVDLYCQCLNDKKEESAALDMFIRWMPVNTDLLERTVHTHLLLGDLDGAEVLLSHHLHSKVSNRNLWKMAVYIAIQDQNHKKVHQLYHQAVQILPYCASLWKEFILYELSQEHITHANQAFEECNRLGINGVQEYFNSLLISSVNEKKSD
ncbi:zinc finger C3H1 domain-containing protein-like isoform X2 [Tachypleus tridentatus]|uniref:zinc finger C3H1 domain-containing protein-like isoform X2 n=1 Tax=Tachypleus tridentatus TaxID=6853 RepID=UPI003FD157F2